MSRWYRAYEGTVTDPKLGEVALVTGCSRSVAIAVWHCILESAAQANAGGAFDTTPRRVSVILGEPLNAIEAVFLAMEEVALIGAGSVVNWRDKYWLPERPLSHEWAALRAVVFARDNYTCRYCMARAGKLQCDHVVPVSRGGGHDLGNLVTACEPCNRSKGAKHLEEWDR